MVGLVEEIQREALDPKTRVSMLLRKVRLASAKLQLPNVEAWVQSELNGYEGKVPRYRILQGLPKAYNPVRGWIPIQAPAGIYKIISSKETGQAIGEIEELISRPGTMHIPLNPELIDLINKSMPVTFGEMSLFIGHADLVGIVEKVRTMILDWAIELEKLGIRGDGMSFKVEEKIAAQANPAVSIGSIGTLVGVIGSKNQIRDIVGGDVNISKIRDLAQQLRSNHNSLVAAGADDAVLSRAVNGMLSEVEKEQPSGGALKSFLTDARSALAGAAGTVRSITLLDDQTDTEISLAENVQREAMHMVDEVLAYKALVDEGKTAEDVAARFGQSVVTVRKRLKLASLSPRILEVLREDGMTLEQAKALALTDDHTAQEAAWFERQDWNRGPGSLRAALTQEHIRATDRLARFVGIEAYESAGGSILRDLFAEDDEVYLADRPLLIQLATERLTVTANKLRLQGWKWVDLSLEPFNLYNGAYSRIQPVERAFTPEEDAKLAALGAAFDALAERLGGYVEGDAVIADDEARQRDIESRVTAITDSAHAYDPQEQRFAGCMVFIGHDGRTQVAQGLVTAEDRKALDAVQRGQKEDAAADEKDPAGNGTGYSAALVEELTAIRTAALRVELAHRPDIALAAILYPLVSSIFYGAIRFDRPEAAVEVSGQRRDLTHSIKEPEACRALTEWNGMVESWGDRLPGDPQDLWGWLLAQPATTLSDLLAVVTATNLNAVQGPHDIHGKRLAQADQIAEAVGLDMRGWWSPQAPFLSRLSKAGMAEVVREAGVSETAIDAVLRGTKADAVSVAEQALIGTAWLPVLLRGPASHEATPEKGVQIAA